jgi:hypothetical protein
MHPVCPVIPAQRCGRVSSVEIDAVLARKPLLIAREHGSVLPGCFHSDTIVGKRLCGVEVEDKHEAGTFIDDHFVTLVFQRDVSLRGNKVGLEFRISANTGL